jgi:hypothetical protein
LQKEKEELEAQKKAKLDQLENQKREALAQLQVAKKAKQKAVV